MSSEWGNQVWLGNRFVAELKEARQMDIGPLRLAIYEEPEPVLYANAPAEWKPAVKYVTLNPGSKLRSNGCRAWRVWQVKSSEDVDALNQSGYLQSYAPLFAAFG